MSILTDKDLKKLCIKPTHVMKRQVRDICETVIFSTINEYGNINDVHRYPVVSLGSCKEGIVDYRELTPEERNDRPSMITPFIPNQVRTDEDGKRILSYGLSSMGYDVRLTEDFKIFTNVNSTLIDPLDFDTRACVDYKGPYCILPPNSYLLGVTVETFDVPTDLVAICLGKSTYARVGIIINPTVMEPGFKGQLVIEISNATSLPIKVYANQGIAQLLFIRSDEPCEVSYAVGNRKYQNQTGVQTALV